MADFSINVFCKVNDKELDEGQFPIVAFQNDLAVNKYVLVIMKVLEDMNCTIISATQQFDSKKMNDREENVLIEFEV